MPEQQGLTPALARELQLLHQRIISRRGLFSVEDVDRDTPPVDVEPLIDTLMDALYQILHNPQEDCGFWREDAKTLAIHALTDAARMMES